MCALYDFQVLKAAEQGNEDAQLKIGCMYFYGEGTPKDYIQAYAWWNIASANGTGEILEDCKNNLTIIENKMTPEQIAEAQELSKELFEKYGKH